MRKPCASSFGVVASDSFASRSLKLAYKGERIGEGRLDLLVGGRLVVELKAIEKTLPLVRQLSAGGIKRIIHSRTTPE